MLFKNNRKKKNKKQEVIDRIKTELLFRDAGVIDISREDLKAFDIELGNGPLIPFILLCPRKSGFKLKMSPQNTVGDIRKIVDALDIIKSYRVALPLGGGRGLSLDPNNTLEEISLDNISHLHIIPEDDLQEYSFM